MSRRCSSQPACATSFLAPASSKSLPSSVETSRNSFQPTSSNRSSNVSHQGSRSMNIHEAVDRLEYLIAHSRQIPLTRTVVIDQEEALACIDDLRLSLPDEIKQARWTLQEQQRLLSEAQAEAASTVSKAGERAQTMIGQHDLVKRAEKQAEAMLKEATSKAEETRRAADRYASEVMQNLESQLLRTVATVKKGVEALRTPAVKASREVEVVSGR